MTPTTHTHPTNHPAPLLQATSLSKTFRDFWRRPTVAAVKNLNLNLYPGEVLGLLGPNGSGKSTTIKMALGLLHPTAGSITLFGVQPHDNRARQRTGYLPEITHLHPFLTPLETLDYYAALFGLNKKTARQRAAELLEMVNLTHAANRPVGSFSKGMARRVGLAQALINAPELLILDEPTSGLDPLGCSDVKELIRVLAQSGVGILMTSHLLADTEDVCDRVAVLDHGELKAEGTTAELLQLPDHTRFTIPNITPDQARAIAADLAQRTSSEVTCDTPAITLENFFLKTVTPPDERRTFQTAPFLSHQTHHPEDQGA